MLNDYALPDCTTLTNNVKTPMCPTPLNPIAAGIQEEE
jgi:hypothetical protein